jgi:uncharacterized protein (DUF1501 family)
MKRRTFAIGAASVATGIALDTAIPGRWMHSLANDLSGHDSNDRILVVVQLSGGNDGLNTVVPYRNELYQKARPKLKMDRTAVISLNDELGLHPSLKSLDGVLESGRLSIVQGVGYPSPNRSHFESMDIWHSCTSKNERTGSGWIGRFLGSDVDHQTTDAPGLHVGSEPLPLAVVERGVQVPSIASVEQMRLKGEKWDAGADTMTTPKMATAAETTSAEPDLLGFVSTSTQAALAASERLEAALSAPDVSGDFPDTGLGEKLKIISRLILSGLKTRIYYVTLDGFDTHANQLEAHAGLLRQWSDAVASFSRSMERAGQQDRVLVMTFSEFGRRVAENASLGTDHGAAAPMFFVGPTFPSQVVGEMPSLSDLDDGDLKFHTDFRSVYATVIEDWLGGSSAKVLGTQYDGTKRNVPLFRS